MTNILFDTLLPDESTAQAIVRCLVAKGVRREKISAHDLQPYYRAMTTTNAAPTYLEGSSTEAVQTSESDNNPVCAVIVETRQHPLLEYVVCQFARNLDIGIQIFHGRDNRRFITESKIGGLIESGQAQLTDMGVHDFSLLHYNKLLLSRSFWESVCGRGKVLFFQTDSILCENSGYTLNDFLEFDYIGSSWNRKRPVGIIIDGGSGGLSLRDWRLTMECFERFPVHYWPGGEDGYFAFHFDLMGGNVARKDDCGRFSTQSNFTSRSFGAHQIQNLSASALHKFLAYCPEAQIILKPFSG